MSGQRRRNPVSDDEIVRAYQVSKSVYVVERELGVSASLIYRLLEKRGIKRVGLAIYRRKARSFTDDEALKIRQAYEGGQTFRQLMRSFKAAEVTVKKAIIRAGGKLVPVAPAATKREIAKIVEWYKGGLSQMTISLRINRSQSFVGRILRKEGVEQRRLIGRRGPNHGMWKGGRTLDGNGYIRVWVAPEDPLAGMRLSDGSALEHRMVMARTLGRMLLRTETVHHINGVKTDNRPENLQLRQGRHGKHVVMRCLDCGSHNVGHAPLD